MRVHADYQRKQDHNRSLTRSLFATRTADPSRQQTSEAAVGQPQVQVVESIISKKLSAVHPDAGLRVQNREHLPATEFEAMLLP